MPFVVPKFIEMEPKIVGPLTFKQFVYVGAAGAICFILYYSVPFYIFLLGCVVFEGGAMALSFLKIGGQPLPVVLKNFLMFSAGPKVYIWRKKVLPPKIIKEKPKSKEKIKEEPVLKVIEKGRLQKLSTQIETKTK
ncbi:hypothetical protein ACFL0A_00120 [Patescibacteria group bacterium]